jgi:hypothetical protein
MNYSGYLKKKFPGYFLSGILAGIFLFGLIVLHRYEETLSLALQDMQSIGVNKENVSRQLREIEDVSRYFDREFGIDIRNVDADGALLRALDEMKMSLQGATFTVSNIETKNGKKMIEVTISAPMESYDMILDYITFIESFRLPDYEVRSFSISKGEAGKVIMYVKGAFVMPASSVQEVGYGA